MSAVLTSPTKIYLSELSMPDLLKEVEGMPTWIDGSGILMTITQSGGIPVLVSTLAFAAVVEISKFRDKKPLHLMINNLPGHISSPIHTDTVLNRAKEKAEPGTIERWHLPIKTHKKAHWWDIENGMLWMAQGIWYGPMPFWIQHQVINTGSDNRVHLIVDLE